MYPLGLESGFRFARDVGYDGVEVMVTNDEATRDPATLLELSRRYEQPILSIHAPVLLLTMFVWGRDPRVKLERAAELAVAVGAETVVVHPPFRWQGNYARDFEAVVREIATEHGVQIAVENMFPWRVRGRENQAYLPGIDPSEMDVDAATLDFSHSALSGRDALELAKDLGPRLRHVHLTDGLGREGGVEMADEHLVPGHGNQPVAEVLELLTEQQWDGQIIAEVSTRKAASDADRYRLLAETLEFARDHTGVGDDAPRGTGSSRIAAPHEAITKAEVRRSKARAKQAQNAAKHADAAGSSMRAAAKHARATAKSEGAKGQRVREAGRDAKSKLKQQREQRPSDGPETPSSAD